MSRKVPATLVHRQGKNFTDGKRGDALANASVNTGQRGLDRAIADSLERLTHSRGLKNLVDWFDGREGEPVAPSTISMWRATPRRLPAVFLPVLVELDPEFRIDLVSVLFARQLFSPSLIDELEPKVGAEVARVIERAALRAAAEVLAAAHAHTSETRAFTQPALMARWGVSRKTLWRLTKAGRLTSVRVGNATLYPREVVEQIERGDLGGGPRGVPRRRVAR